MLVDEGQGDQNQGEKGEEDSKDDGSAGGAGKDEAISKTAYERLQADLYKQKQTARELAAKLKEKEDAATKAEEDKLRKNKEYETLADRYKKEADDAKTEKERLNKAYLNDKKHSAVKEAAMKLGIRNEALDDLEMLDLSDVTVETTSTGRVNVLGTDKFAERLKTLKPHWFGGKAPNVNTDDLKVQAGKKITMAEILKLEKEAKKTNDNTAYHAALKKWKSQPRQ